MDCFVVSNCTHAPIREYLAATGLFSKVGSCAIFNIPPEEMAARYDEVRQHDLVVSAVLYGDKWGPFEHTAMKADLGDRCILFNAPFFEGLHPDLIHVSLNGERFQSPIGDYHSGLIFWGFMTGRKIPELIEMREAGVLPEPFDPVRIWDNAINVLRQREVPADVRIAERMVEMCRHRPAMLTFNHPTMDVVATLCEQTLALAFPGRNLPPLDTANIYNILLSDVVIPVDPAVVRAFDLPYTSSPLYKFSLAAPQRKRGYIDFAEYARLSYSRYACVDRDLLAPTTPDKVAGALAKLIEDHKAAA